MKTFTSIVALSTLLSTTYAATVKLQETPCLQDIKLESFDVTTDSLFVKGKLSYSSSSSLP
jgi:hypothetical protein